ncbi:MAG: 50S ribosomal protein L4 [Chlamydiia bacterium]|nr:50S ribosomal protein L4 [Chlamydiia bacterium]
MATLKKYNMKGEAIGDVEAPDWLKEAEANSQMVKDCIVAIRANARQWNAHTKTRSEVAHTTKKPHRQKGSGRARQGSLVAPQMRGGGRVFGPRKKVDQYVKMNKKERKAVVRHLVAEKIRSDKLFVIDSMQMEAPKTKDVKSLLGKLNAERRPLFLAEGAWGEFEIGEMKHRFKLPSEQHNNLLKSLRNLQKTEFSLASNVNSYELMVAENLIVSEAALHELVEWLS